MSKSVKRVLYLEDNPADALLLTTTLKSDSHTSLTDLHTSFEVTVLEDGEKALRFIDTVPFLPDAIVLDIGVPRIDGLTVLAALKTKENFKGIPVLVFVQEGSRDRRKVEALRAEVSVSKPSDLRGYVQVCAVIRELCARPQTKIAS